MEKKDTKYEENKTDSCSPWFVTMSRRRVPLEQLLASLRGYHTYLAQDPCSNPRAQAYVEARISYCQRMSALRNDSIGCGEAGGCAKSMYLHGPKASNDCSGKEIATT